ncbi:hypothetical protein TEH_05250 [Tetragenococcus halophilus NBRC 12172]|uniref:Uncharacterized protein n=1 Tax=Tetragenococcus halophilus (strain DSM 20338 / JCM 20259 / NCIMB 9735 / NBRC 12172) TaxID=945021 RepID=A0AAN1SFK0_TETHN|nr:hypothetical protein TEH_05250 [Tetragenococcus halophilus NBRC 12172]
MLTTDHDNRNLLPANNQALVSCEYFSDIKFSAFIKLKLNINFEKIYDESLLLKRGQTKTQFLLNKVRRNWVKPSV